MAEKKYLTQTDFARLPEVNKSKQHIWNLVSRGELTIKTLGGVKFVEVSKNNIERAKKSRK